MKHNQKVWLAAGLLAGAAALTGCSMMDAPAGSSTPDVTQKITAQPQATDAQELPDESAQPGAEDTPLALTTEGKEIAQGALLEGDILYLPLVETAEALGWAAESETTQEEALTRRSVSLAKQDSRITVSWVVSDNTAKQITWQKDGLLIPVNTELTTVQNTVYVPAAFFETAMDAGLEQKDGAVIVSAPKPKETPANDVENANENEGNKEGNMEGKTDAQNG